MTRVLIAGVSTRAAAASAVRAGFDVTTVDAFGDLDQPSAAQVRVVPRFSARAAARAVHGVSCDAVMYLSNFENDAAAVAALAAGRALWGNPPEVLARVRDPFRLAQAFGLPEVRLKPDTTARKTWLVKPFASGGGHRVRRWVPGSRIPGDCYLQEYVEGTPASVVFIAANGQAMPLGVSRQLIGDAAFGAAGYRYCGNILAATDAGRAAADLARQAAAAFGLVGANGIDFIARGGEAIPIEINPRWSASMELVERAHGISVFAAHAAACMRGELPPSQSPEPKAQSPEPKAQSPEPKAFGKAIVFAREDVQMGDTRAWLADATVADVPQPGARIARGRPICTVFADGDDDAACHAALVSRAAAVYAAAATREAVAW